MLWKQDSEEAKRRMEAWWHQEVIDRVCIQVTAPRSEPWDVERIPVPPQPSTWEEYLFPQFPRLPPTRAPATGRSASPARR